LLFYSRQGFGGRTGKSGNGNSLKGNGQGAQSAVGFQSNPSLAPSPSPAPQSPALHQAMSFENVSPSDSQSSLSRRPPFFFREEYSNLIVKGNFMTLAAKPVLVEEGEWLAHQGKDLPILRKSL
jgi:hypothetical protein